MPNATNSVDQASATIICGTLTSTATTIDAFTGVGTGQTPFTNAMPNIPCRAIRIMAPTANTPGAQVNTSDVLVGDGTYPNETISPDGSRDQYFQVDNANKLHFKFITSGDKLEFRIET